MFGGTHIPAAADVALTRLLCCATAGELAYVDRYPSIASALAEAPTHAHVRLWWKVSNESGNAVYISIFPGEVRTQPPATPFDAVNELPDDPDALTVSELLRVLAHDPAVNERSATDRMLAMLVAQARRVTGGSAGADNSDAGRTFAGWHERVRDDPKQALPHAVATLYDECLQAFRMPAHRFVDAISLLQLQAALGLWIEPCDYAHPRRYLLTLVERTRHTHASELRDVLTTGGNTLYESAKSRLADALTKSDLAAFSRDLAVARVGFLSALQFAELNRRYDVGAALHYSEVMADEGATCVLSSLMAGANFFVMKPLEFLRALQPMDRAQGQRHVGGALGLLASPVHPIFPRRFARLLIDAAAAYDVRPQRVALLAALENGRKELDEEPWGFVFEQCWLDLVLLNVYRLHNDVEMTRRYANRFAARIVAERRVDGRP